MKQTLLLIALLALALLSISKAPTVPTATVGFPTSGAWATPTNNLAQP